jgi:site-specific DNA-methyltransferase (adenine-specific)
MQSVVHNTDCLEAMRGMPDNAFDLAIVDPPYGIDILNAGGQPLGQGFVQHRRGDWDKCRPTQEYFDQLLRVSKNYIVCGANYFCEYLKPTMGWIFWYKGGCEFSFSDGEIFATSFNTKTRYKMISRGEMAQEERIHKTQKPVSLYKWLLMTYANLGDSILDTHLGSGSSRIAAYDLGFDFTGYELDKDYLDAQEQRFANHIAQPKLFSPVREVEQPRLMEAAA